MMHVCVSVAEATLGEVVKAIQSAQQMGADLAEVRFDRMERLPEDLSPLKNIDIPKIATLRSKTHGGEWDGGVEAKVRFLRRAIRAGFELIDIEDDSPLMQTRNRELRGADHIISHHDLITTPSTSKIIELMLHGSAVGGLPKGAFTVNTVTDLHNLVTAGKLLAMTNRRFILLGMGELGEVTRLRHQRMGSYLTYASLNPGKETAPGQLDVATMKSMEKGIIVGIAGNPLDHSYSPAMHQSAFAHLGIAGRYLRFPTAENEVEMLMENMRDLEINGMNVTIPHKESIMEYLDKVDDAAQKVGAVNVVVNREGRLIGRNTDVSGLAQAFQAAGADVEGKRSLIIGAGGAARACAAFLQGAGAALTITNRTHARAEKMARDFSGHAVKLEEAKSGEFEVIVNCTPIGMEGFPSELPIAL